MAREWLDGKGTMPDLLHMVRDMPRGAEMGGLEAGFLTTVDAVVRGDRKGAVIAADPVTKAQQLLEATPAFDVEAFRRRRREQEVAERLERLGRANAAAWEDLGRMTRVTRSPDFTS